MASWTPEHNAFLSCLLDDVTGTEQTVKTRQDSCMISDCLLSNTCFGNFCLYYTGSRAEGLDLSGSDDDYMFDINKHDDIDVAESSEDLYLSTCKNKYLIITENVPAGFVLLKCVSQIQDRHLFHALVNTGDNLYLSSQLVVPSLQGIEGIGYARRVQGPSVELCSQYAVKYGSWMDNVFSFRCKGLCYRWRDIGTPSGRKSKIAEFSSYDTLTP